MSIPEEEGTLAPREVDEPESGSLAASTRSPVMVRTRISRMWVLTLPALIALIAILILVVQNRSEVTVRFFEASLKVPLSVAVLGAATLGALVVLTLGSARVVQLRRRIRVQSRSKRSRSKGTATASASSQGATIDRLPGDDSIPLEGT